MASLDELYLGVAVDELALAAAAADDLSLGVVLVELGLGTAVDALGLGVAVEDLFLSSSVSCLEASFLESEVTPGIRGETSAFSSSMVTTFAAALGVALATNFFLIVLWVCSLNPFAEARE